MLHTPTAHFIRHYAEMVLAMLLGMVRLGRPAAPALEPAGVDVSSLDTGAPELLLLGMATNMTVPMVAWMRVRGHRWTPCWEMSASMYLPTVAAMALMWAGTVGDAHAAMGIQHLAMFPAMLVAMLLRRGEYGGHAHEPARAGS